MLILNNLMLSLDANLLEKILNKDFILKKLNIDDLCVLSCTLPVSFRKSLVFDERVLHRIDLISFRNFINK